MVDIDHFKDINDTHGHLVGDEALREIARVLQGAVRTVDLVGRYGGEEFVIVLPETTAEGAIAFAERLRDRVSQHVFASERLPSLRLTISIGVASYPTSPVESVEDLFARADEALYRAKAAGRNAVRA
jgi:diguanylate cyclase (GGDEF)-like protein